MNGRLGRADKGKLGFWFGARAVFSGAGYVAGEPRSWPYALVPPALLITLIALFSYLTLVVFRGALLDVSGQGFWGQAASWVLSVIVLAFGIVLALALTPPLSGPALERIVALRERSLGAPPRAELGMLAEIWCGVRAQVFLAMFALPILIVLWIVELVFAPAAVVTVPLAFVVTSFSLAWNLIDYPLTLRGVRMRDRFNLLMRHKRVFAGFGAAFAVLFWIPCCGVLLLPVGAAAATELIWRILETDPEALPALPRRTTASSA